MKKPLKTPTNDDLLASYIGLLALATLIIYAASFGSLKSPPRPEKVSGKLIPEEDDDEYDEDEEEIIDSTEAYLFPVFGSAALLCLYYGMKHLGKDMINDLLGVMFGFTAVPAVFKTTTSFIRWSMGPMYRKLPNYKIYVLQGPLELFSWNVRFTSIPLSFLCFVPSIYYLFLNPIRGEKSPFWTVVLAVSYAYTAVSLIKMDSFRTGLILLGGLFLYDIWWVFGTNVMVDVATNIDLPIKLLWPKSQTFATNAGYTMLGLGDVVVPGLFIAMALRYDQARFLASVPISRAQESFPKPYFTAAIISYVIGLATTMGVMHFTKAAQPALLYLSPACALSFVITALTRGEFAAAWAWSEEMKDNEFMGYKDHPIIRGEVEDRLPSLVPPEVVASAVTTEGEEEDGTDGQKTSRKRLKKRRG